MNDPLVGYVKERTGRRQNNVWHANRMCTGNLFTDDEQWNARAAQKAGYRPCRLCADGRWPERVTE